MATPSTFTLDDLDAERPTEPFTVQGGGRLVGLAGAAGAAWSDLLEALAWPPRFVEVFGPADPGERELIERLSIWQMRTLLRAWRRHHGLCASDDDHMRLGPMLRKAGGRAAGGAGV